MIDTNFKNRRDIVPKWVKGIVVFLGFFYSFVLVVGNDNLFDFFLNFIINYTGPDASLIYALAYLLCLLVIFFPLALILQVVGFYLIQKKKNSLKR
ncbi:MAG: hypothetical protein HRT73_10700 [Flavobacteriales bacterium]|nr:hypothetical protein [Flavobacteriales bacterium]NQX98329.1 hypothetical protein [Flavobacteriales bacterium]